VTVLHQHIHSRARDTVCLPLFRAWNRRTPALKTSASYSPNTVTKRLTLVPLQQTDP